MDALLAASGENLSATQDIEVWNYMSYWYGGMYVVIEGWEELKLHDEKIDKLLQSQNKDLLRRYRNGTFHFQKDYFDARFTDLMKEGEQVISWIRELREAFSQYFLNFFQQNKSSQDPHP